MWTTLVVDGPTGNRMDSVGPQPVAVKTFDYNIYMRSVMNTML